jgi:hypothetical protein
MRIVPALLLVNHVGDRVGKVKLTDSFSPDECQSDANRTAVVFESTVYMQEQVTRAVSAGD